MESVIGQVARRGIAWGREMEATTVFGKVQVPSQYVISQVLSPVNTKQVDEARG